jgi:HrpA-like RNA helicase
MIQTDPKLTKVSHVIIDEVHERGVESDFLLILLRDLLQIRLDLRVVLMSATIESSILSKYFDCPVIDIPGFTHPVEDHYLEEILEELDYVPKNLISKAKKNEDDEELEGVSIGSVSLKKLVETERNSSFSIDYELIARVVGHICSGNDPGAILIFLPGIMEIKKCIQSIQDLNQTIAGTLEIFPLHSNLTTQEQSRVFKKMPPNKRKVVVSTNIAETSVTIDDVVYVIDAGRVKEMKLINNVLSLVEVWASLAACKQRRGRAGRVQPGKAFKLFTSAFAKKYMPKYTEPEILRLPLEQLCLQIKSMDIEDTAGFLAKALTPPPNQNVQQALELLEKVQAIDEHHRLTALGRHISLLPTDIRIAKMLVYGAIFHCIDPVLTIATSVSGKSPFLSPMDRRQEASEIHKQFHKGRSDHLTLCRAYDEWIKTSKAGKSKQWAFCESSLLSMQTLTSMFDQRKQFLDILIDMGYVSKERWAELNSNSKNEHIVKAVILAGLYPNVASIKLPKQLYDQTAEGAVAVSMKTSEIHFYTKADQRVFIHPSSSLFAEQRYQDSVLVYGSKVATSKIFLRDCSCVPAMALFLLGGKIQMLHGGRALEIDGVRFQAFPRVSALITGLRRLLDKALAEKIHYPDTEVLESAAGKMCIKLLEGVQ